MATVNARGVLALTLGLAFVAVIAFAQDRARPGFEFARPDGFHVVLLLARNTPGTLPTDLPTGVAKALKEASEVLPYKSYQVQDQAVSRSNGSNSFQVIHLIGPLSRDYELALDTRYREPAKVSVTVNLSYTSGETKGATGVLSTEFNARLGETVVVGTSKVNGDESLVLLITPLAATGKVPAEPTKPIEEFRATEVSLYVGINNSAWLTPTVHFAIRRWSTDSEHQALIAAVKTGRPGALAVALRALAPPVGRLIPSPPLLFGTDDSNFSLQTRLIYAAQSRQATGARRITIFSLSADSPSVIWIEFAVQPNGYGKGFVSFDCRVGLNKEGNAIELKAARLRRELIRVRKE
jgi:hypothetical protein